MNTQQHHHEWTETTTMQDPRHTWACTTCPATAVDCSEGCGRVLESHLIACDRCIAHAKELVQDVIDALDTVPFHHAEIMGLRAVRYDRDIVSGGGDPDRLPFGMDAIVEDVEDQRIGAAKHPATAVDILRGWAVAWSDTRGDDRPADELAYLVSHTQWAVQNPDQSGWATYRDEARQVRATVRRLLGILPVREPAPCVHCNGTVAREWTDDGLDDLRRCQRCGTTWPNEDRLRHLNAQIVQALPQVARDAVVTMDDAKRIYRGRVHPATFTRWASRGVIPAAKGPDGLPLRDVRGDMLYPLAAIDLQVTTGESEAS